MGGKRPRRLLGRIEYHLQDLLGRTGHRVIRYEVSQLPNNEQIKFVILKASLTAWNGAQCGVREPAVLGS